MLGNFEIRQLCPSVSFLFALLGASLGSFRTRCPSIKEFAVGGHGLSLVLTNLFPLLHQFAILCHFLIKWQLVATLKFQVYSNKVSITNHF